MSRDVASAMAAKVNSFDIGKMMRESIDNGMIGKGMAQGITGKSIGEGININSNHIGKSITFDPSKMPIHMNNPIFEAKMGEIVFKGDIPVQKIDYG